jgi:hypothetical protein
LALSSLSSPVPPTPVPSSSPSTDREMTIYFRGSFKTFGRPQDVDKIIGKMRRILSTTMHVPEGDPDYRLVLRVERVSRSNQSR